MQSSFPSFALKWGYSAGLKLHKITDKTTNVSRRYNSSSSGTKSKHRVESMGSLKTGNNGQNNTANLRNQKIHLFTAKRISLLEINLDCMIFKQWMLTNGIMPITNSSLSSKPITSIFYMFYQGVDYHPSVSLKTATIVYLWFSSSHTYQNKYKNTQRMTSQWRYKARPNLITTYFQ